MSSDAVCYDRKSKEYYSYVRFDGEKKSHCKNRDLILAANGGVGAKSAEKVGRLIEFFCLGRDPARVQGLIVYRRELKAIKIDGVDSIILKVDQLLLKKPLEGLFLGHRGRLLERVSELAKNVEAGIVQINISPNDFSMINFFKRKGYKPIVFFEGKPHRTCFVKSSIKRTERQADGEVVPRKGKVQRSNAMTSVDIARMIAMLCSENIDNKEQQSKERDA